jgi:hypothetical protein
MQYLINCTVLDRRNRGPILLDGFSTPAWQGAVQSRGMRTGFISSQCTIERYYVQLRLHLHGVFRTKEENVIMVHVDPRPFMAVPFAPIVP